MVNHHQTTIWQNILAIFPSIEEKQIQDVGPEILSLFGDEIWGFPKKMVPQNGRFIMENPIKMDD